MKTKEATKARTTAKDIEGVFGDDVHKAYEYVKSLYMPYPTNVEKPHLAKDHTSKDAKEYSEKLVVFEKAKEEYAKQKSAIQEHNGELDETFVEYIKELSGLNTIVPADKRSKVWSKAWSDGHSDGYPSVYYHLRELVDLFE